MTLLRHTHSCRPTTINMAPAVHNVTHGTNPHVVAMPRYSTHIGIARLILSVVVLTLVATAAGLWSSAHHAAFGLTLFTVRPFPHKTLPCLTSNPHSTNTSLSHIQASATLLIKLYYTLSLTRLPHLYHPYAILACEALGTVFWLTSFALCAEWTAAFNHHWWTGGSKTATNYGFWNAPFRPEDMGLVSREVTGTAAGGAGGGNGGRWKAAVGCMGATAGLSGVLL